MANSPIAPNRTKRALAEGRAVVGTMIAEIRQPAIMQILVNGGFDYAIIDNEHGPFNIETIADLSRTAVALGLTPIVRVPDIAYPYIAQSLDGGAQGIMAPRIYTAEQTMQVVDTVKYPPVGQRGSALSRGYTAFCGGNVVEVMAAANQETLVVIQIETVAALDAIDAIVSVPGVDVAFIGPNDLSIALGVPGQTTSPVLIAAIEKVMEACARHGVTTAIQMNDLKLALHWAERGIKMMSYSAETGMLTSAALTATTALSEVYEKKN
jgi:2-keto-3-deoxy-L-rhamnonate aldolase RhmA